MLRQRILLFAIPLLVAAAWLGHRGLKQPAAPMLLIAPPFEHPEASGALLHTTAESAEVFRRAFWREPAADDQILHAERREWVAEGDGIRRWQWFITVRPGPELRNNLLEIGSIFPLHPTSDRPPVELLKQAPAWFPRDASPQATCHRNNEGTFWLIDDPQNNLIHATDQGSGFSVSKN
jgi:hypothetical protein